jgi:chemotaxis protein methyltransferase CheR
MTVLDDIAELVRRETGIVLPTTRTTALLAAVDRAAPGLDPRAFLRASSDPVGGHRLLSRLIEEVTVKETTFARDRGQLEAISWHSLLQTARAGGSRTIRVWSVGCASGEEAYTLALLAAEAFAPAPPPVDVLGTDISTAAVAAAVAGRYRERAVRGLEPALRRRYLDLQADASYLVGAQLRSLVRVRQHNLARDPIPPLGEPAFDVITCRNVLIYFDRPLVERVIASLKRSLRPGGVLLLGAADALHQTAGLHMAHFGLHGANPQGLRGAHPADLSAAHTAGPPEWPAADVPGADVPGADVPAARAGLPGGPAADVPAARAGLPGGPAADVPGADVPAARTGPPGAPTPDVPAARTGLPVGAAVAPDRSGRQQSPRGRARSRQRASSGGLALHAGPSLSREQRLTAALDAADAGDREGALAHLATLLAADPLDADAHYIEGLVKLEAGNPDAAAVALRRALYTDPYFGLAAFALGRAYDALGDRRAVRRAYRMALRTLDPNDDRHGWILQQVDIGDIAAACRTWLRA